LASLEVEFCFKFSALFIPFQALRFKNQMNWNMTFLQLSWFGAQKFCHQGGWLLGSVTSATFEKETAAQWQGKSSQYVLISPNVNIVCKFSRRGEFVE